MDLREVNSNDVDLIYEWANDLITRAQSYSNKEKILYKEHVTWFQDKLSEEKSHFLIFLEDNTEIGMVRFDLVQNHWIVSINIDPSDRGKGYSVQMLKDSREFLRSHDKKDIYAYIKKENIPSIKAFRKAGYKKEQSLTYKGIESYLYICK